MSVCAYESLVGRNTWLFSCGCLRCCAPRDKRVRAYDELYICHCGAACQYAYPRFPREKNARKCALLEDESKAGSGGGRHELPVPVSEIRGQIGASPFEHKSASMDGGVVSAEGVGATVEGVEGQGPEGEVVAKQEEDVVLLLAHLSIEGRPIVCFCNEHNLLK